MRGPVRVSWVEQSAGGSSLLTKRGDRLPVTSVDGLSWANLSFRCAGSASYQLSSSFSSVFICCSERS